MTVDLAPNAGRLLLQTKLRSSFEDAARAFLGQIFQRRLTPPRACQRNICSEAFRQRVRIDTYLKHLAVRLSPSEKLSLAFFREDMQHSVFESGIDRMTVRFPI